MKKLRVLAMSLAIGGLGLAAPEAGFADAAGPALVHLGNGVVGALYEPPSSGPKAGIAVFAMHAEGDYLEFSACTELSKRGYRVLCANNSASKSGSNNDLNIDRALLDAKQGVAYLRKLPGVRKIVLLGHSGGGALLSAYQAIAEAGLKACQGPEKLLKCSDTLAGLPPADGLILLDANYGMSTMSLLSLDPAITDESTGQKLDPSLDLFNPANGFVAGATHYSVAFKQKFQTAVGERENRLIRTALERLEKIQSGKGLYGDDEPFVIPGAGYLGFNNKLFSEDPSLLAHTHKAWPLIHKDGSVTTEIVHSVRVPEGERSATPSLELGALKTTVRKFLSTYAVGVDSSFGYDAESIHGVRWTSSYTTPPGNVENVTVPLLTLGMTGHWEYLAAEIIYDHAKSADKSIAFVEGASHIVTVCGKCERTPGEFGDTVKTTYDFIDGWLSRAGRF